MESFNEHVARLHAAWLLAGQLQKMVLVVSSAASKDVLERWTFDVLTDRAAAAGQCVPVQDIMDASHDLQGTMK